MKKSTQAKILTVLTIIIIALVGVRQLTPKFAKYLERKRIEKENIETISLITEEDVINKTIELIEKKDIKDIIVDKITDSPTIPNRAYLEVPFICQAPLETEANWVFHEESCEEAAILQAYLYETGQTMTKEEANEEILEMLEWQETNWNGHYDIYAKDIKRLTQGFYGIPESEIEIIYDATINDIKEEIASGHPVIVPVTADYLDNPYYLHPGYHMLTAIGYTEDKIITNDNGTKRGKDFSYDYDKFERAMNDAGGDIIILKLSNIH